MRGDRTMRRECAKCGRALPYRCFSECKNSATGHLHRCKACTYRITKQYIATDKPTRQCKHCLLDKPTEAFPKSAVNRGDDCRCSECDKVEELDRYHKVKRRRAIKEGSKRQYARYTKHCKLWRLHLRSIGKAAAGDVYDNAQKWVNLTQAHPEYKEVESMKAGAKRVDAFRDLAVALFI